MKDYNIIYLENKEKQNLETINQLYDLNLINKHQATRIKFESDSINYRSQYYWRKQTPSYSEIFDSQIQTDQFAQIIILATKLSKTICSLKNFEQSDK